MVTLTVKRDGKLYASKCIELGTASCGATKEEAFKNIQEATLLYLNTLEDLGICEETLDRLGVPVVAGEPVQQPLVRVPKDAFARIASLPVMDCVPA
jgi:predicted RNase H-like HicB family nuclease